MRKGGEKVKGWVVDENGKRKFMGVKEKGNRKELGIGKGREENGKNGWEGGLDGKGKIKGLGSVREGKKIRAGECKGRVKEKGWGV